MAEDQQMTEQAFDYGYRWGSMRAELLERLQDEQVSAATFNAVTNLIDEFPTAPSSWQSMETVLDAWSADLGAEKDR